MNEEKSFEENLKETEEKLRYEREYTYELRKTLADRNARLYEIKKIVSMSPAWDDEKIAGEVWKVLNRKDV